MHVYHYQVPTWPSCAVHVPSPGLPLRQRDQHRRIETLAASRQLRVPTCAIMPALHGPWQETTRRSNASYLALCYTNGCIYRLISIDIACTCVGRPHIIASTRMFLDPCSSGGYIYFFSFMGGSGFI